MTRNRSSVFQFYRVWRRIGAIAYAGIRSMPPVWRAARGVIARATPWLMAASCGVVLVALAQHTSPSIYASRSQSQSATVPQASATAPQGDEQQARAICGV